LFVVFFIDLAFQVTTLIYFKSFLDGCSFRASSQCALAFIFPSEASKDTSWAFSKHFFFRCHKWFEKSPFYLYRQILPVFYTEIFIPGASSAHCSNSSIGHSPNLQCGALKFTDSFIITGCTGLFSISYFEPPCSLMANLPSNCST